MKNRIAHMDGPHAIDITIHPDGIFHAKMTLTSPNRRESHEIEGVLQASEFRLTRQYNRDNGQYNVIVHGDPNGMEETSEKFRKAIDVLKDGGCISTDIANTAKTAIAGAVKAHSSQHGNTPPPGGDRGR